MKNNNRNESKPEESNRWSPIKEGFKGLYVTSWGKWWGFCHKTNNKNYRFFLFNPPKELRNHPHWSNFYSCGRNWYGVAFAKCIASIEEGIQVIERALRDAFAGKKLGLSQAVPIIKRKDPSSKKITSEFRPFKGLKN